MREEERAVLERWKGLVTELKSIPHLPIHLDIDLNRLREEATLVTDFYPHRLHTNKQLPEWYMEQHHSSFQGQCLVDYIPDNFYGMADAPGHLFEEPDAQFDEMGRLKFFVTPLGQKMPYTISVLQKISPYINRTRIIKTAPGGGIFWHSHHNGLYDVSYLRLCIFNIPLYTNNQCLHRVRDYKLKDDGPIYAEHYKEGKIYLFNSWHDHDFWNQGQTPRLTIIPYFNFPDEALLSFLEEQVNKYEGPRISP